MYGETCGKYTRRYLPEPRNDCQSHHTNLNDCLETPRFPATYERGTFADLRPFTKLWKLIVPQAVVTAHLWGPDGHGPERTTEDHDTMLILPPAFGSLTIFDANADTDK
jgi:hypothetical protein